MIRLRRRSLVDMLTEAIARDPGDAPQVYLEVDIMADDMERYAPTAQDPLAQHFGQFPRRHPREQELDHPAVTLPARPA